MAKAKKGDVKIQRPVQWGGYRVKPVNFEFWQGDGHREHDRFKYSLEGEEWTISRLAP